MAVYIPDALKTIQVAFHPPIGFSGTVMIQNVSFAVQYTITEMKYLIVLVLILEYTFLYSATT